MIRVIESIEAEYQDPIEYPGIAWVPRPWINEWEHGFEGRPGSFMVHFACLAEMRLAHMAASLNELHRNQKKWEVPLENMSLKHDVSNFWQGYAANVSEQD
jgi:hypothetical protein